MPADLAALVNAFYFISTTTTRIEEWMPAYSAQCIVYLKGGGTLRPEGGAVYGSEVVNFMAPLMNAVPCTIHGPTAIVGASHKGYYEAYLKPMRDVTLVDSMAVLIDDPSG